MYLTTIPESEKDRIKYAETLTRKTIHIEHILPCKWWNHYDKWDQETHEDALNKLGNLIPLDRKLNITASNEFFARKQEEYKNSDFPIALKLAKKRPSTWYPTDVDKRQRKAARKLKRFFREPFGKKQ